MTTIHDMTADFHAIHAWAEYIHGRTLEPGEIEQTAEEVLQMHEGVTPGSGCP